MNIHKTVPIQPSPALGGSGSEKHETRTSGPEIGLSGRSGGSFSPVPLLAMISKPFAVDPTRITPASRAAFGALQAMIADKIAAGERKAGHMGRLPLSSLPKRQAAGHSGGIAAQRRMRTRWDAARIMNMRKMLDHHMPHAAIGERLGMSAKSVKVQIFRLREKGLI